MKHVLWLTRRIIYYSLIGRFDIANDSLFWLKFHLTHKHKKIK